MSEPTLQHPLLTLSTASAVCALIILDTNIVAVSLPTIARDLNASLIDVEWIVSAYLLTFAALLLPAGNLADRFGRKRTLLWGLSLFTVASVACALSPTLILLDIARAVKGVGAALLLTCALASITHCFQRDPGRAKAWAFWGTTMGVVITSAPLLGGVLTVSVGWRWIFWINVPIGLTLAAAVSKYIPESGNPKAARLDPLGAVLFSVSLACVMWALIEANRDGWESRATFTRLAAGGLLFALLIWAEKRQSRPMIDLALFRSARFNAALMGMFAYAACAQVMMTLLPFYLQSGLSFSPVRSGLGMLPFALAMLIMPRVGGRLAAHFSPSMIMGLGLAVVGFGNFACAYAIAQGGYLPFAVASALLGAGAGLLNGDTQKNIMACVPLDRLGMGSGMSTTMRFTAISLGIGIYGALLTLFTQQALIAKLQSVGPQFIHLAHPLALQSAVGDLEAIAETLPLSVRPMIISATQQAFAQGFSHMLSIAAMASLVAALLVGYYLRRPLPHAQPAAQTPPQDPIPD